MRWFGCVALFIAAPASAQTFDLVEQNIVADVRGSTIRISARATVEVDTDTSVLWLASFAVPLVEVRIDGTAVPIAPHPDAPDWVSVATLPRAVAAGTRLEVEADLEGSPRCTLAGSRGEFCFHSAAETILMMSGGGFAWFVSDIYGIDPFIGTITVLAPAGRLVRAGQGTAVEEKELADGSVESRYRIDEPTSLVPLYAGTGRVAIGLASSHGAEVIYQEARDDPAKAQMAADVASEVATFLSEHYAHAAPDPVRIVLVPRTFAAGGMGLLGNVFMAEYAVGELDFLLEQGVAHELSHTWWGGFASLGDLNESGFFHEAFAEYSAWLALGELRTPEVRVAGNRMNAVWYMYGRPGDQDVAIFDPRSGESDVYVHAIYHKGSLVLRSLEHELGAEALTEVLRALIAEGPGSLGASGFREALRTAGFSEVDRFFAEWLEATGFPRISAATTWSEGTLEASFAVDGDFTLALPLRATFQDGTTQTTTMPAGSMSMSWALPERPTHVEVDPEWSYAREVVPALPGDVTLDGEIDGADAIAVALQIGNALPDARRIDGSYDPLYDVITNRAIDRADLDAVVDAAQ